MWQEMASRLKRALAAAAEARLGPEHPFVAACHDCDLTNLRALLDTLPPAEADALLLAAHEQMREQGPLELWSPEGRSRPN